ncbi:MAG: polysaccharide deacetylase family protein [Bacteroidota bacterium]
MYFIYIPDWLSSLFPAFLCHGDRQSNIIYLTFDDGPIPHITPWVLDVLADFDAKATFFCVGDNVRKHPDIYQRILAEQHTTGNHTFHHLDAWKTKKSDYLENIQLADNQIDSQLFRPPYGHLTYSTTKALSKGKQIVLWDVLSGDFDETISSDQCWQNVKKHTRAGSVIVFHDSQKAEQRLRYALPKTLAHFSEKGFRFEALSSNK